MNEKNTKPLDLQRKYEKDLQRLQRLRLLDDDFMSKVFEDLSCAQLLLRIILARDDLRVVQSVSQYTIKNLQGRSVRLDILAVDAAERVYNVEVQRDDRGASAKRARYNSSLIDANATESGEEFEKLNEVYVIFITENDVMKCNLPLYHIDRMVRETGAEFADESHIIYVNAQVTDETALGRLMHDFTCTSAKDMHYRVLADRVRYFKEDEEGVANMSSVLDELREEGRAEGREEGREEGRVEGRAEGRAEGRVEGRAEGCRETSFQIAAQLVRSGKLVDEEIAAITNLTVDEVRELSKKEAS